MIESDFQTKKEIIKRIRRYGTLFERYESGPYQQYAPNEGDQ